MKTLWFSKSRLPDDNKDRKIEKRPFCVGHYFSFLTFQGDIGNIQQLYLFVPLKIQIKNNLEEENVFLVGVLTTIAA